MKFLTVLKNFVLDMWSFVQNREYISGMSEDLRHSLTPYYDKSKQLFKTFGREIFLKTKT
jgi:hypothetical protein